MKPTFFRIVFLLAALSSEWHCGAAEMSVRQVFGKASSPPDAQLQAGEKFTTGPRSKAELSSARGVVRLGEEGGLEAGRNSGIVIRRGVTLVASNPGLLRKSIEVRAPGYRARVKGTAQIAYEPGRSLRVVVLEGSVTVALDSLLGEFETLTPGQQLIINPSDNRLPEPVEIDLGRLVATSQMVGAPFSTLSTQSSIAASITNQGAGLLRGDLAPTLLMFSGTERELHLRDSLRSEQASLARKAPPAALVEQTIFKSQNDLDNPRAVVRAKVAFDGVLQDSLPAADQSLTLSRKGARTHLLKVEMTSSRSADPITGELAAVASPALNGRIRARPGIFAGDIEPWNLKRVRQIRVFNAFKLDRQPTFKRHRESGFLF